MLLPRTLYQASEIERAGRTYLLAYRQLNSMSSSMNDLAWVLTPKWHVSWWRSINLSLSSLTFGNFIFGILHMNLLGISFLGYLIIFLLSLIDTTAEAFSHVCVDAKRLQLNPRFTHTFADEDQMSQLKKWARRSIGKKREMVVSRLSRMRLRTLLWKLPELANRAK